MSAETTQPAPSTSAVQHAPVNPAPPVKPPRRSKARATSPALQPDEQTSPTTSNPPPQRSSSAKRRAAPTQQRCSSQPILKTPENVPRSGQKSTNLKSPAAASSNYSASMPILASGSQNDFEAEFDEYVASQGVQGEKRSCRRQVSEEGLFKSPREQGQFKSPREQQFKSPREQQGKSPRDQTKVDVSQLPAIDSMSKDEKLTEMVGE